MKIIALCMTAFLLIAALSGCDQTYTLTVNTNPTPTPTPPPCSGGSLFGNINPATGSVDHNYVFGSACTNVDSASVTALAIFSNASGNAILGIYTDNAGSPDILLGQTAGQYCTPGWNFLPLTLYLYPGIYWLMVITDTANVAQTSSGGIAIFKWQPYGPMPSQFSAPSTVLEDLIIGAAYTCP